MQLVEYIVYMLQRAFLSFDSVMFKADTLLRFYFISILIIALSYPQLKAADTTKTDSIFILNGRVFDPISDEGLFYAHILNLSYNSAAISDRHGNFRLRVRSYDTLYLSHVGFKKQIYYLGEVFQDTATYTINLYRDTVVLERFRLLAASKQVQFRTDFLNKRLQPDTLNPAFTEFIKETHFSAPSGGIILPGPATMIYETFNRSARLKRKIEQNRARYFDNLPEEEKRKVLFHSE